MRLERILQWPLDDQQAWAARKMDQINDSHTWALHLAGWKIVSQSDPDHRWPFSSKRTRGDCPDWCEDISKPRAAPTLSVIVDNELPTS